MTRTLRLHFESDPEIGLIYKYYVQSPKIQQRHHVSTCVDFPEISLYLSFKPIWIMEK